MFQWFKGNRGSWSSQDGSSGSVAAAGFTTDSARPVGRSTVGVHVPCSWRQFYDHCLPCAVLELQCCEAPSAGPACMALVECLHIARRCRQTIASNADYIQQTLQPSFVMFATVFICFIMSKTLKIAAAAVLYSA